MTVIKGTPDRQKLVIPAHGRTKQIGLMSGNERRTDGAGFFVGIGIRSFCIKAVRMGRMAHAGNAVAFCREAAKQFYNEPGFP
jgi:hypothetical protein